MTSDIPVKLSLQDCDHLLAAVEWALNHQCGEPNDVTLNEYITPGLHRWAIEMAARKIESVAALQRAGISQGVTIQGHINPPHSSYSGACPCGGGATFENGRQVTS
jgi:hypothetical protein